MDSEHGLHTLRRVGQTPRAFRNWPAVLFAMARERAGGGPATLTFRTRSGMTISCPNVPGARVPVYEIFAEDCYRLSTFLTSFRDRPLRVIDIGGHIGTFACRLAQLFPFAQVDSFEASAVTARHLRINIDANGFSDRVTVHELAVAAGRGTVSFADNDGGSGLNGLVSTGRSAGRKTEVPSIGFDDIVAEAESPPDVVKLDCEGGEYDIVFGSSAQSWRSVSHIVLEYHRVAGKGWPDLCARFAEMGFDVAEIAEDDGMGCVWLTRAPRGLPV